MGKRLVTYKFRIKDSNKLVLLNKMKRDVSFVWNVLNSASRKRWAESRKYFHKFDPYFTEIYKGFSIYSSLHSQTVQAIAEQFHKDIRQAKKQLRFRGKKSLGWVPFKASGIKLEDDFLTYKKQKFKFYKSREIKGKLKTGSFQEDTLGRWFVCFTCELEEEYDCGDGSVGIDLGFKTTAVCSNGDEISLGFLKEIDKKNS